MAQQLPRKSHHGPLSGLVDPTHHRWEEPVGDQSPTTLARFVDYLPQIQALHLDPTELAAIRVHPAPPSAEEFLSLGELPPGAPPVGPERFPPVGTRLLYAFRSEVPAPLWNRLTTGLAPHRPSGSGGTGMFGNEAEKVVDGENAQLSWRRLNAGENPWPG
jgi:hypothetical protein